VLALLRGDSASRDHLRRALCCSASDLAKARANKHWIGHSGITYEPILTPFNGPQIGVGESSP
jgi:hypothetical protein